MDERARGNNKKNESAAQKNGAHKAETRTGALERRPLRSARALLTRSPRTKADSGTDDRRAALVDCMATPGVGVDIPDTGMKNRGEKGGKRA